MDPRTAIDSKLTPIRRIRPGTSSPRAPLYSNGIKGFRGLAKVRPAKFKGLPQHTLHLRPKETEWRYHHQPAGKYQTPLRYLR